MHYLRSDAAYTVCVLSFCGLRNVSQAETQTLNKKHKSLPQMRKIAPLTVANAATT